MLAKNALLEEIVEKLSRHQPSLSTPLLRMQQHLPDGFTAIIHELRGLLAEKIVQHSLEEVCGEYGSRVVFPEIPEGAETEHFQFFQGRFRRLACRRKETGNIVGDYDCLLVADGLPTLVEVKLINTDRGEGSAKRRSGFGTNGLHVVLSDEYISHIMEPLQEYFSTEKVGYVIVALPERANRVSELKTRFREQGGLLIPFYTSRQQYQEQTLPLLQPWVKEFPYHYPFPPGVAQEVVETLLAKPLADELLKNWFLSPDKAPLPKKAQLPQGQDLTLRMLQNYLFRRHVITHLLFPGNNGCWQKQDEPQGEHGDFSFVPNPWEGAVIYRKGRSGRLATLSGLYSFTYHGSSTPVVVDCTPAHKSTPGRVKAAIRALTGQEPYLLRCMEVLPGQKPGFYPEQDGLLPYSGRILLPPHQGLESYAEDIFFSRHSFRIVFRKCQ